MSNTELVESKGGLGNMDLVLAEPELPPMKFSADLPEETALALRQAYARADAVNQFRTHQLTMRMNNMSQRMMEFAQHTMAAVDNVNSQVHTQGQSISSLEQRVAYLEQKQQLEAAAPSTPQLTTSCRRRNKRRLEQSSSSSSSNRTNAISRPLSSSSPKEDLLNNKLLLHLFEFVLRQGLDSQCRWGMTPLIDFVYAADVPSEDRDCPTEDMVRVVFSKRIMRIMTFHSQHMRDGCSFTIKDIPELCKLLQHLPCTLRISKETEMLWSQRFTTRPFTTSPSIFVMELSVFADYLSATKHLIEHTDKWRLRGSPQPTVTRFTEFTDAKQCRFLCDNIPQKKSTHPYSNFPVVNLFPKYLKNVGVKSYLGDAEKYRLISQRSYWSLPASWERMACPAMRFAVSYVRHVVFGQPTPKDQVFHVGPKLGEDTGGEDSVYGWHVDTTTEPQPQSFAQLLHEFCRRNVPVHSGMREYANMSVAALRAFLGGVHEEPPAISRINSPKRQRCGDEIEVPTLPLARRSSLLHDDMLEAQQMATGSDQAVEQYLLAPASAPASPNVLQGPVIQLSPQYVPPPDRVEQLDLNALAHPDFGTISSIVQGEVESNSVFGSRSSLVPLSPLS